VRLIVEELSLVAGEDTTSRPAFKRAALALAAQAVTLHHPVMPEP
jgi:hypothetical protein